jgi:putative nucleotidyltransferase with HDIG domain
MGIEFFGTPLSIGGINNFNIGAAPKKPLYFGNTDTFEYTSANRYTSEAAIKSMIAANPKVSRIMAEINAPMVLNMSELKALQEGHMNSVKHIAAGITENLPAALKEKVDAKALENASLLHDIGKVLIPADILNKPDKLDEDEMKIMQKHSELGYELLKTTGIDKYTLELIKNHHQTDNQDFNLQILRAADKYSALTEKRTYKEPINPKQSLTIMYSDVREGKLHPFIFRALVDYANSQITQHDQQPIIRS